MARTRHPIIQRYSAEPSRIHPRESWTRSLLANLSQIVEAYSIIPVHPVQKIKRASDGSSDRGVAQYGRSSVGIAMAILLAAS
ncbi:hypothetical protein ALC62_11627 [Cyphomyrmex costatus]|uniref:Uncharacterized protein n=1 Tax=Cyphomyrmex costatus TaxID=456900 RepID=A0A151IC65_9HYME|nr:hypothetical protein ALC62_11627 [Cyphomyrmex costatus]